MADDLGGEDTTPQLAAPEDGAAPRRRRSYDERRAEFVANAIEFFAQEGFESSTRGLARRLNVTQPLLYRYFPSKDDLIAEVYEAVYVQRWREEWGRLLTDRTRPVRDRMIEFYHAYTDAIFNNDWMRIFLFSGLKGVGIHGQYLGIVRERIIETMLIEMLHERGLQPTPLTEEEVEFGWTMHGGIFYYGVRMLIYKSSVLNNKSFVLESVVDAWLSQIETIHTNARARAASASDGA
jgi:AcrR family transcriptional regulator